MKYVLLVLFSLIYCPVMSVIITVVTLFKGIWGNGFYLWMDDDELHMTLEYPRNYSDEYWRNRRFYIGEIFRLRFIRHWWNINRWHDETNKIIS